MSISVTSDEIAFISLAISFSSVVVVLISPYVNYRIQKNREARDFHKVELRDHVLRPLLRAVDSFWRFYLWVDEFNTRFPEISDEDAKNYAFNPVYSIETSISLPLSITNLNGNTSNEWFDSSLFKDLNHHYVLLAKKISETNAFLRSVMTKLEWDRWTLTNELHRRLKQKTQTLKEQPQTTARDAAVTGMLLILMGHSRVNWPSLYESLHKQNLDSAMLDIVEEPDLRQVGMNLSKMYQEVHERLFAGLNSSIEKCVISGKSLKGKCPYLTGNCE